MDTIKLLQAYTKANDAAWAARELLMGHVLICTAEVIDKMNEERKRDSSANAEISHGA